MWRCFEELENQMDNTAVAYRTDRQMVTAPPLEHSQLPHGVAVTSSEHQETDSKLQLPQTCGPTFDETTLPVSSAGVYRLLLCMARWLLQDEAKGLQSSSKAL
ncbi:hypothetical protein NQZ68_024650 [Dissostichus eleginoides]|nr:hypothetical protein NQZ68_024650 [Dissostichus eleginoides]